MQSIKIIGVPPGQAPNWVRKRWVGVEIPLPAQEASLISCGVIDGKPNSTNAGGYQVETVEAINALRKKNPQAAAWWDESGIVLLADRLMFAREVCELISDEEVITA